MPKVTKPLAILFVALFLLLCAPASILAVNGEIIAQDLAGGQGYTVLHVWGTHYEMGYAHGYLLADWVQLAYQQFSVSFGAWWTMARTRVSGWTFLPPECMDEFSGMLAGVRAVHPETTMDLLDLEVASTIGDWLYSAACRSTCCWDELVEPPFTTLAMRKLQFMQFPSQITQQWHHVICAWEPSDGSPLWVNFGFPGYVSSVTGINEYGTIASLHDWNSSAGTDYPDALPRTMACRYVLTMDLGPDPSTHLQTAFDALQPYHAATGGFLNYYVPDGGAGVIKHSKNQGFYAVRVPQPEWMNGHVIDTNNSDIDGRSGIAPWAPYYLSLDPPHGVRATMAGLWSTGYEATDMHVVALGLRGWRDIAIWFEGRLQTTTTGRVELEWSELFRDPSAIAEGLEDDGGGDERADRDDHADRDDPAGGGLDHSGLIGCQASPNPARADLGGDVVFAAVLDRAILPSAPSARIIDAEGRLIRVLQPAAIEPCDDPSVAHDCIPNSVSDYAPVGSHLTRLIFRWDGRDRSGLMLRPGIYLYSITETDLGGRLVWLGP